MNFVCFVVVLGWIFFCCLINLICGLFNLKFYIRLNKDLRVDLEIWVIFIDYFNGKLVFLDRVWVLLDYLSLYIDVFGLMGFLVVLGFDWFVREWLLELEDY